MRLPLLLASLAFLSPSVSAAADLSGRYELRGVRGWLRPVRTTLVVQHSGPRSYRVEREVRAGGSLLRFEGDGWQEGSRLRVRFHASPGLAGALSGAPAPAPTADYRILGRVIGGSFQAGAWTTREAGRRTGPPPTPPAPVLAGPSARTPAQLHGRLRVQGPAFVDPLGREVLLRGVNAGSKQAPFLPAHDAAAVESLVAASGANLVRLYVAWRAIEPEPLRYDPAYLDAVVTAVRRWSDAGVYVLLDMHQDVWGGPLASHGAPAWATLHASAPALSLPAGASWQMRYLDERCYRSFEAFWSDAPVPASGLGLQEHYARAWAQLAGRLRGLERVVGYDLMNEPFVGLELRPALARLAVGSVPTLLSTGFVSAFRSLRTGTPVRDTFLEDLLARLRDPARYARFTRLMAGPMARFEQRLARCYARVGRAVRAVDPGRPIFVEPMALAGVGVPSGLPDPGLGQVVYAPHLYDAFVDSGLPYDGDPSRVRRTLELHRATAHRLGAPLVLGEWGHLSPRAGNPTAFAHDVGALLDEARAGSAYWEHTPGKESDPLYLATVRPYPRRVAGRSGAFRFDPVSRRFELEFAPDPHAAGPTAIAAPAAIYPGGPQVRLSRPGADFEFDSTLRVVLVWAREGGPLRVTLEP